MIAHAVGVAAGLGEGLDPAGRTPGQGERDLDRFVAWLVGGRVGVRPADHDGAEAFEFDVLAAGHGLGLRTGSGVGVVVDVGEQQPGLGEHERRDVTVDRFDVDVGVDVDEVGQNRFAEERLGQDSLRELRVVAGRLQIRNENFG